MQTANISPLFFSSYLYLFFARNIFFFFSAWCVTSVCKGRARVAMEEDSRIEFSIRIAMRDGARLLCHSVHGSL